MKKAQVKMTESIGVLIVFFFLIVIGFIFYTKFQTVSFYEQKGKIMSQKAVEIAQIASHLPEIQCSFGTQEGAVEKSACLDLIKLQSAQELLAENSIYYYDLLYYSNITVNITYPDQSELLPPFNNIEWPLEIYSNVPNYTAKIKTLFPVLLRDVITDASNSKFYFGVLTVDVYTK